MRILNPDGSEVDGMRQRDALRGGASCGEPGGRVTIETGAGLLRGDVHGDGAVTVDMGAPRLGWAGIPLARAFADTASLDVSFDVPRRGALMARAW